ncbi:hypothetical protein V5O48_009740, partial [Marasmius crinis-equi]
INAVFDGPLAKPNIPVPYYNISLEDFGRLSRSEPIELFIPTGSRGGLVPPFNIAFADATSLFWWTGHDTDSLRFRVRSIPEERLLEIWPDSSYWDRPDTGGPPSTYPLLSVKLSEDGTPHNFTFPPSPHSSSPSLTYPLRLGLLFFLVPFGIIGILLSMAFFGILHGILELISLLLKIAALGVICIAVYGVYWWVRSERTRTNSAAPRTAKSNLFPTLRRTLLRLCKFTAYTTLTWIIFAISYATLPSPVPDDASVIASLQNGRTVVRVFDKDLFFLPSDLSGRYSREWKGESFAMEFRLAHDSTSGSQLLMFGRGHDILDDVSALFFRISGSGSPPEITVPYYNLSIKASEETKPSVSSPVMLTLPVADVDDLIYPPAGPADAALLAWWVTHDSAHMRFRIREVPEERLIEIWSESDLWSGRSKVAPATTLKPLISITLDDSGNPISFAFPPAPYSSSPSAFHPIRLALMCFLRSVATIAMLVMSGIFQGMLGLFALTFQIATLFVIYIAIYGIYWWTSHERPCMNLFVSHIREVLNGVLDNVRTRDEQVGQGQRTDDIDLEANAVTDTKQDGEVRETLKDSLSKEYDDLNGVRS